MEFLKKSITKKQYQEPISQLLANLFFVKTNPPTFVGGLTILLGQC